MLAIPLVPEMMSAAAGSVAVLRDEISDVRLAPIGPAGEDMFSFSLRGQRYHGCLRGRNRVLVLGFGDEPDRAIALRALLDGDAAPVD